MRLFCFFLFFFLSTNTFAESVRLKFCFEHQSLFPFYLGDSFDVKGRNPGVTVEELSMVTNKFSQVKLEFVRAPWERCKKFLYSGMVDAVLASYKKGRGEVAVYPVNEKSLNNKFYVANNSSHFYKLKGKAINWNGQQFTNYEGGAIGYIAGHSVRCLLIKHGVAVKKYYNLKQGLKDLQDNKIAAFVSLTMPTDYIIEKNIEFKNIIKSNNFVEIKKYYLVFSKKFYNQNKKLAQDIWDNYVFVRKSNSIPLLKKYFTYKNFYILEKK